MIITSWKLSRVQLSKTLNFFFLVKSSSSSSGKNGW